MATWGLTAGVEARRGVQSLLLVSASTPLLGCRPCPSGDPYRADHLVEGHLEGLLEDAKNPLTPELKRVRERMGRLRGSSWQLTGSCGTAVGQLWPSLRQL
jgi:hypothetical protein